MAYANGQVPFSVLIHLGANFWLPPGTAARWLWFVAEGKRRFGVTFRITPDGDGNGGWNAYRPYSAQVLYKKKYGNMAASPGTSSHGGFYRGQEVFAIDVDNWSAIKWADFTHLANEAGFRVDFVSPREQWHIGDFNNPWIIPAFAGGNTSEDNDLTPDQDTRLRNIENLLTAGGPSLNDPSFLSAKGTVLRHLQELNGIVKRGGEIGDVRTIQDNADTNTMVRQILERPAVSLNDAQLKVIADAVAKQISGDKPVVIDYAKIAESVRAKFASNPLK